MIRSKEYIDYLIDSFLVEKSTRYDIKGKRYINSPYKYYFMDLGLPQRPHQFPSIRKESSDGEYGLQ